MQVSDDPQNAEFWSALGGYQDPSTLAVGEPDTEVAQKKVSKLFEIVDKKTVLVSEGELDKNMLVSEKVFLVHATDKLFVWVGKQANLENKRTATQTSVDYVKSVSHYYSAAVPRVLVTNIFAMAKALDRINSVTFGVFTSTFFFSSSIVLSATSILVLYYAFFLSDIHPHMRVINRIASPVARCDAMHPVLIYQTTSHHTSLNNALTYTSRIERSTSKHSGGESVRIRRNGSIQITVCRLGACCRLQLQQVQQRCGPEG